MDQTDASSPSQSSSRKSSPDKSSVHSDAYQRLLGEFQVLETVSNPLEQEYALIQQSKDFESANGLAREDYRQLFQLYLADQRVPDWLERTVGLLGRLDPIAQSLQSLAFVAIIVSAVQFLQGLSERQAQVRAEKWQIVNAEIKVGTAKREALEYLHDRGELLSNVEALDTQLSGLNLPGGGRLQEAQLRGANLYQAYLADANLYRANLASEGNALTNLDSANLAGSDLRQVNFQGANLQNACLVETNLEAANFQDAYLVGTDFRGARYLTAEQVKQAATTYERALYDEALAIELGVPYDDASPAAGCRVSGRRQSWWAGLR